MKKKLLKKLLLISALFVLVFIFNYSQYECLNGVENKVKDLSIRDNDLLLDLNRSIDCFEWNRLVLIPRDFESINMKERFNIDITEYDVLGLKSFISSDFHTYIVFLNDDKIISKIDFSSTGYIDNFLTDLNKDIVIIDREDCVFHFIKYKNYLKLTFQDPYLNEKYGISL